MAQTPEQKREYMKRWREANKQRIYEYGSSEYLVETCMMDYSQ